jgi:NAD(P)-dependent dehydrogenase (short-subunit alcohol dehydrogenase family)
MSAALQPSFPRTALVTGGASGIGAATVALLVRDGAEVQVLDLLDGFDVGDPAAWEAVEPVEFAFLNAGVATGVTDVGALTDELYRRALGANVDGVVFGVRRLARVMAPGSAIVATASLAGLTAMPHDPIYTLTKHAVVGFVRSVAPQLAERGIRVNAVCPGYADTPIVPSELRGELEEQGLPLLIPERVAEAVLAAARSPETGQAWVVQPGREPLVYEFRGVPGPR